MAVARRTQAERREATQAAILNATIECLIEEGYANTTTTKVVERAGVSRGAQVHHFPTKASLVAAAVSYLADLRAEEIAAELAELPGGKKRLAAALDLLWHVHQGPLFAAAIELWVAARTDSELRAELVPVERRLTERILTEGREFFGELAPVNGLVPLTAVILNAVRGLAMNVLLFDVSAEDAERRWRQTRAHLMRLIEASGVQS
jgi:AcrR family transcriptional regulator